jgi:transcriptional regulator with XRE-family HTH domain
MYLNEILAKTDMTIYKLAKNSGVPYTTVHDIHCGKTRIEKCSGETLYKLAKTLGITIERLIEDSMECRPGFEWYKSQICHLVKSMGDLDFIIDTLESDKITGLWNKKWYAECIYLLGMLDYLSRENDLPFCDRYDHLRSIKFQKVIYPAGILAMSAVFDSDELKQECLKEAIPEFLRHNIVESEVRNVV